MIAMNQCCKIPFFLSSAANPGKILNFEQAGVLNLHFISNNIFLFDFGNIFFVKLTCSYVSAQRLEKFFMRSGRIFLNL